MTASALVAAIDFNEQDFLARYEAGLFNRIIAVDAGFACLEALDIKPDLAIGDFDSLGYLPKCKRVSRHPVNKDKSDLELAMDRAFAWNYDEMYIYGALAGRLDHTIANLQLFARFSEKGVYVTGIGMDVAVRMLTGPDVFDIPEGIEQGTVSVFSLSDQAKGVIERGLLYSFDDETLTNRTSRGVSNELQGKAATVAVEKGTLCILYPLSLSVEAFTTSDEEIKASAIENETAEKQAVGDTDAVSSGTNNGKSTTLE